MEKKEIEKVLAKAVADEMWPQEKPTTGIRAKITLGNLRKLAASN